MYRSLWLAIAALVTIGCQSPPAASKAVRVDASSTASCVFSEFDLRTQTTYCLEWSDGTSVCGRGGDACCLDSSAHVFCDFRAKCVDGKCVWTD